MDIAAAAFSFETYEPRPEYRQAVRITAENAQALAEYVTEFSSEGTHATATFGNGRPLFDLTVNGDKTTAAMGAFLVRTAKKFFGYAFEVVSARDFEDAWRLYAAPNDTSSDTSPATAADAAATLTAKLGWRVNPELRSKVEAAIQEELDRHPFAPVTRIAEVAMTQVINYIAAGRS